MLDLTLVNWRIDRVTQDFITEHESELIDPASMSPAFLAETTTYCQECENPFSEELVRRAQLWKRYAECYEPKERCKIIRIAAKAFGIILY